MSLKYPVQQKQKAADIGHAEIFHHDEDDLEELHGSMPKQPTMKISNRFKYWVWSGTPMDADGTISWLALLRSFTREVALSYLFYVILSVTIAYMSVATVGSEAVGALAYATISAISVVGFMTYRHTRMLPTQLNYALTLAEMPSARIGPHMQLWYILAGLIAVALSFLTTRGLTLIPVGPDWTAGAGGHAGAFSTGGAILYYAMAGLFYVFAFQHNQTLDLHTYYNKSESSNLVNFLRLAFQVGGIQFAIGFIGYFTGMWDVNPNLGLSACLAAGTCNAPITGAWALRYFVPLVGGLGSFCLQLWTWDQNSLPSNVFRNAAKKQAAAQYGLYDGRDVGTNKKRDQGRKVDNM